MTLQSKRLVYEGRHYSATLYYAKGGTSVFTGHETHRGYHLSVEPIIIENRGGVSYESRVLGKGYRKVLVPVARASKSAEAKAIAMMDSAVAELLPKVASVFSTYASVAEPTPTPTEAPAIA